MVELVGLCVACKKEVFCRNGFLDGVVTEDKKLYCNDCARRTGKGDN